MNNSKYLDLEITEELARIAESYEKRVAATLYDGLQKKASTYGFFTNQNSLLSYSSGSLDFYKDFLRYMLRSKPNFMTRQTQNNNMIETDYKKFKYTYSKKNKQLKYPIEYSIDGGQTWQILSQDRQDTIGDLGADGVKSVERLGQLIFEEVGEQIFLSQVHNMPLDKVFNYGTSGISGNWKWDTTLGLQYQFHLPFSDKLMASEYHNAIKLDHKSKLDRFHFGTETYTIEQLMDDTLVELATNMIRSRIVNIWPVYYSVHSGDVLLTSEMLRNGKFYWKNLDESIRIQATDLARYIESTEANGQPFYDKFMRQAESGQGIFMRESYSGGQGFVSTIKRAVTHSSAKLELWYVQDRRGGKK